MVISGLVRSLLEKRGLNSEEKIAEFLEPDYVLHTHDPFMIHDMDRAVERVLRALARGERIAVYADFDCDGIPGAALLSDFFRKIEYPNIEIYLPHRDREGYGFHIDAIRQLKARGVSLIITVDVGGSANDAVAFAGGEGVDVIVTDHHELKDDLPSAYAVLNPKITPYPFPDLCGSGVAFKLVQALIKEGKHREIERFVAIRDGWEKWLLDLVAIATVADMVPLVGENRVLAHWGLRVLRKSTRLGIDALVAKLRLRKSELTEDDIGFSIAPRINAASRMDEPDLAFKLLTTQDRAEAQSLATELERLNASRKGVVAGVVREARKHVRSRFTDDDTVVVVGSPSWKPALLGLAANSIVSDRGGVACLWGRDANGNLKGSCRADDSVSVTDLFAAAGNALLEYGGHQRSGGFSVSHERVHELPEIFREAARSLIKESSKIPNVSDASITLPELSRELFGDVSLLAPFGVGNPKPVFLVRDTIVIDVKRFGKERNHVEVSLECRSSGTLCRAFDFFRAPEDFTHTPAQGVESALLATIERDTYRGGLCLRIVDIVPAF